MENCVVILVEGPRDKVIVNHLLFALARITGFADLPHLIEIKAVGGKQVVLKKLTMADPIAERTIGLVDADAPLAPNATIPNAFFAVPTAEAWLFADLDAAIDAARSDQARQLLERAPLPENIPYPKLLAQNVFSSRRKQGPNNRHLELDLDFLKRIDVYKAASRCPSLRIFLTAILEAVGGKNSVFPQESLGPSVGREAMSSLLSELPPRTTVWKTVDGTSFNARDLARLIREGDDIGKQYATELLRVARDLIVRKAKK